MNRTDKSQCSQEPKGSGRRPQAGEVNKCDNVIANW